MAANTTRQLTFAIGANVLTLSKQFAGACAPGTRLIAGVSSESGDSVAGTPKHDVYDTGPFTKDIEVATALSDTTGRGRSGLYSKANESSAAVTVNVDFLRNEYALLVVWELQNADGTPEFNSGTGTFGESVDPFQLAFSTSKDNCSALAMQNYYPSYTGTPVSPGFTNIAIDQIANWSYKSAEYDLDVGVADTYLIKRDTTGRRGAIAVATYSPPVIPFAAALDETLGDLSLSSTLDLDPVVEPEPEPEPQPSTPGGGGRTIRVVRRRSFTVIEPKPIVRRFEANITLDDMTVEAHLQFGEHPRILRKRRQAALAVLFS